MTSALLIPSAVRRPMYALVRRAWRSLTTTMRYRAALALRSPPRLSRWRLVLPEEAGIGLTPHSEAKAASEWRRSGLLPAVIRRVAAVSGPMPK